MVRSNLLGLPPEIRQTVYRHLFKGSSVKFHKSDKGSEAEIDSHIDGSDFLITCKQLHSEAQPVLAASLLLSFGFWTSSADISPRSVVQENYLRHIQYINVKYHPQCRFELDPFPALKHLRLCGSDEEVLRIIDVVPKTNNVNRRRTIKKFLNGARDELHKGEVLTYLERNSKKRLSWIRAAVGDPQRAFKITVSLRCYFVEDGQPRTCVEHDGPYIEIEFDVSTGKTIRRSAIRGMSEGDQE